MTLFFWAPKSLQMVTTAMKLDTCSLKEKLWEQASAHRWGVVGSKFDFFKFLKI